MTTLLFILFVKPEAKHGPATADIFVSSILFLLSINLNFSTNVSNLSFIIVKPLVSNKIFVSLSKFLDNSFAAHSIPFELTPITIKSGLVFKIFEKLSKVFIFNSLGKLEFNTS